MHRGFTVLNLLSDIFCCLSLTLFFRKPCYFYDAIFYNTRSHRNAVITLEQNYLYFVTSVPKMWRKPVVPTVLLLQEACCLKKAAVRFVADSCNNQQSTVPQNVVHSALFMFHIVHLPETSVENYLVLHCMDFAVPKSDSSLCG
jgi:hypothetical protein